jgi:hypothetical protein
MPGAQLKSDVELASLDPGLSWIASTKHSLRDSNDLFHGRSGSVAVCRLLDR